MQSSTLPPPVSPAGPAPATSRWTISPIAVGGVFVALALQLIFAISYIGALHEPAPHGVPFGVVAPPQVAATVLHQLRVGGGSAFNATSEPSMTALLHALDERSLYGGLVFTPRGIHLIVADAAGLAAEQALTAFAQGIATARNPTQHPACASLSPAVTHAASRRCIWSSPGSSAAISARPS